MTTTINLYVIPYLWILTIILVLVVAVVKGIPILHAIGLYQSKWSFWIGAIVLVFAGWCMLLEYLEGERFLLHLQRFGQEPRQTAMLVTMIYVWVMIAARFVNRKDS